MKKILSVLIAAAVMLCCVSCTGNINDENAEKIEKDGKISIVTTIFPMYDFARRVAGDAVSVKALIKPGTSSHDFASNVSLSDYSLINKCDIFVYCGGETDQWIKNTDNIDFNRMKTIEAMSLVKAYEEELVEGMEDEHEHDEDEHDEDEHDEDEHGEGKEFDEHVWTNPQNAVVITNKIRDYLCEIDAKNAKTYTANAKRFCDELNKLDNDFRDMVSKSKRKLFVVADRFPFRYLAEAYGLEYSAAFAGCSTQSEASLSTINHLIDTVEENKIPVVFYTDGSTKQVAGQVADATGVKLLLLHSCHDISSDEFNSGEDYLSLMKQNLINLKEALN